MVTKNVTYETNFGVYYNTEEEALRAELENEIHNANKDTKERLLDGLSSIMSGSAINDIGGMKSLEEVVDAIVFNDITSNTYKILKANKEEISSLEDYYGREISLLEEADEAFHPYDITTLG